MRFIKAIGMEKGAAASHDRLEGLVQELQQS